VPPLAGYIFHPGGPDTDDARGFFAATSRKYDFQQAGVLTIRGLVTVERDALGHDTAISYDAPYTILPISVTDPMGLVTKASYDYRSMKPRRVTDPNANSTVFTFTPLSLLENTFVKGKQGEGDEQAPSIRQQYDFLAFDNRQQPILVHTVRRAYHDTQTEVPLSKRDETIETIEYSDGFGRLVQSRTQGEDAIFGDLPFGHGVISPNEGLPNDVVGAVLPPGEGPRVIVSGWQTYNNKGKVVEKFEPFFSNGWDYAIPSGSQYGQKTYMYYDPRGLITRTVNRDGSEQRVVYGVPGSRSALDLTNPDVFEPTTWETYTYDANDNAGRTHPATSGSYQSHWNTPSSVMVDALGRTIESIVRKGPNAATDWHRTSATTSRAIR
jgi:hypothetical protein